MYFVMTLSGYIKQIGYGTASSLAVQMGVHASDISNWARENRTVPVMHCVSIEKLTNGAVTRRDLRPNDWHLIWPELADQQTIAAGNQDSSCKHQKDPA